MGLIAELKRRNVIRMAGLYLVGAWLMVQVAATLLPTFEAPPWVMRALVMLLAFGVVPTLVFSWIYELTPEGLKRDAEVAPERSIAKETGRRIDRMITVVLALALGYFAMDKFVLAPKREAAQVATEKAANAESAAAAAPERSIAVLPFADMSQEHDQEYFSDGIAEELLNRLAQFPDLRVAARTSAFQFKGKNLDVADIGQKLKVAHVLEGSVRKSGTKLRITAQLIKSETGFHLWSQTFERDAADVFQVQDEIAAAIAAALEAKLSGKPQQHGTAGANPAAYDMFLKGRDHFARRVGDNLKLAVEAFDRAIALDPGFSRAHSGRAFALAVSPAWVQWMPQAETFKLATQSADEALRLDPDNAEAYVARGIARQFELRIASAREDFERAVALAPDNVDVLNFYGDFLEVTNELRRAEATKRRAMALDPLAFVHPMNLAGIFADQGRFAEALTMAERVVALGAADVSRAQVVLFFLNDVQGRKEQARAAMDALCWMQAAEFDCAVVQVVAAAHAGRKDEARRLMARVEQLAEAGGFDRASRLSAVADLYANEIGDIAKATAAQRVAMREANWAVMQPLQNGLTVAHLPEDISTDPEWLALWNDPKYKELMDVYRANLVKFRAGG